MDRSPARAVTAHCRARMRAAPLVARVLRAVAHDRGCSTDDLSQTLHDAVEAATLVEIEELIDPWGGDRHTPLVPELQGDRAPAAYGGLERPTVRRRRLPRSGG